MQFPGLVCAYDLFNLTLVPKLGPSLRREKVYCTATLLVVRPQPVVRPNRLGELLQPRLEARHLETNIAFRSLSSLMRSETKKTLLQNIPFI